MGSRLNLPIEKEELYDLLDQNENEVIWKQRNASGRLKFMLFIQLVILAYFIYNFSPFNLFLSLVFVIPYIVAVSYAFSMKYSVSPSCIEFNWGILEKNNLKIPFENITTVALVKYKNSNLSTIHIGTNRPFNFHKLSLIDGDSRPHITLENIKNGDKVHELLQVILDRSKEKLKLRKLAIHKQKTSKLYGKTR